MAPTRVLPAPHQCTHVPLRLPSHTHTHTHTDGLSYFVDMQSIEMLLKSSPLLVRIGMLRAVGGGAETWKQTEIECAVNAMLAPYLLTRPPFAPQRRRPPRRCRFMRAVPFACVRVCVCWTNKNYICLHIKHVQMTPTAAAGRTPAPRSRPLRRMGKWMQAPGCRHSADHTQPLSPFIIANSCLPYGYSH